MDPKTLIQNARIEREKGDLLRALDLFLSIDRSILSESQIYDYIGELGLTYFHLKDFDKAKTAFEEGLNKSIQDKNISYQALFLRHLSKKEFGFNKSVLLKNAIKARELAENAGRNDLVWFDQGVISALISINSNYKELKKWFEIEAQDLYKASQNTKDETSLWVWVTGMLIEKYQVDNDKSHLYLALILAEKFSLERRKEQIHNLL